MAHRSKLKNAGFTLVELLLVVGIMMGLAVLEFQKLRRDGNDSAATQAGDEFSPLTQAMQSYVIKHMSQYQDMNNATTQPGIFPGVCAPVPGDNNVCQLDLGVLRREGFMPGAWGERNMAMRTGYSAYVRRLAPAGGVTTNADYDIESFVRTNDAWRVGGAAAGDIEWAMLGSAVKQAGPLAGVVRDGFATGLFGAWSMAVGKYPGMSDGQLAASAKANAGSSNQYVKLDGSLPMTGSLNMGNNRVNNINDIQLLGPASLPRQGGFTAPMVSDLAPNWVLKNVYSVVDFDTDNATGSVPRPTCPDSADAAGGVPRIFVKMSALYNEMYGGLAYGQVVTPTDTDAQAQAKQTGAFGGWNFYALENTGANTWQVYVRRYYDNGYIPGEALAEVYCYYP